MIRNPLLLPKTRIYDFEPHTFGSDSKKRKKEIRDKLIQEIKKHHNLDEIINNCRDKKIFIRVQFNLWNDSTLTERANRDLGNLLKLLLDSICDHIDNNKKVLGLGIITDDSNIFQILANKKLVANEAEEGFEIEMYEYSEN